jgi:uncharacterized membrane protein YeaQ/YmgE (transglycosylase-associated protein family)
MDIVSWILFGLISGALARFFVPGSGVYGLVVTTVLVVGALVGGFISTQIGVNVNLGTFDLGSLAVAVGGSIILLLGYRALSRR